MSETLRRRAAIGDGALVRRERLAFLLVLSATFLYACLTSVLVLRRHADLLSGAQLANVDQALWLISQGERPVIEQHGGLFWDEQLGATSLLLAPLYEAGGRASLLLVVQALAMAAVAPLLYALARAYGAGTWTASLPGLLWLASPVTLLATIEDFHHLPLVAPAIVGSLLALKRERIVLFWALAAVACLAKEDVALMYVVLGVVLLLESRRRRGVEVLGGAVVLFAVAIVASAIIASSDSVATSYASGGRTLVGQAAWVVSNPAGALGNVWAAETILIVFVLLTTTGWLCLLAPRWMLLGAPALASNLLADDPELHSLRNHHWVPVALAFSIAAAVGVPRLASQPARVRLAATAAVTIAFASAPFALIAADDATRWTRSKNDLYGIAEVRQETVETVGGDTTVAASPRLTPHLSRRAKLYALPMPFFGRSEYESDWSRQELASRARDVRVVVLDTAYRPPEFPNVADRLVALLPGLGFREVANRGSVLVYERGGVGALKRPVSRQSLREAAFGSATLPRTLPAVRRGVRDSRFPFAARVDRLTVKLDRGLTSVAYDLWPARWNGRTAIYHNGHVGPVDAAPHVLRALVRRGWRVVTMAMPLAGENAAPGFERRLGHDPLVSMDRPLGVFLEPVVAVVNYARPEAMIGLSGGGWTTVVAAAIDPRIRRSYPVAGSMPFPWRCLPHHVGCQGDLEQRLIPDYLRLYELGSGPGRRQLALYNLDDSCCFMGTSFRTWAPLVRGNFDAVTDPSSHRHAVTPFHLRAILDDLGTP